MANTLFSVTTGNPQTVDIKNPGGAALIGIQNDGANVLTVEGKLGQSAAWAALGTVAAATISGVTMVPGIVQIRLSSTAASGVVIS